MFALCSNRGGGSFVKKYDYIVPVVWEQIYLGFMPGVI